MKMSDNTFKRIVRLAAVDSGLLRSEDIMNTDERFDSFWMLALKYICDAQNELTVYNIPSEAELAARAKSTQQTNNPVNDCRKMLNNESCSTTDRRTEDRRHFFAAAVGFVFGYLLTKLILMLLKL